VVSVYSCLRLGVDVLFQDADVVWWRDPRPFFRLPDASSNGVDRWLSSSAGKAAPGQHGPPRHNVDGGAHDAYFQVTGFQ
jgi:hypothetical protein